MNDKCMPLQSIEAWLGETQRIQNMLPVFTLINRVNIFTFVVLAVISNYNIKVIIRITHTHTHTQREYDNMQLYKQKNKNIHNYNIIIL